MSCPACAAIHRFELETDRLVSAGLGARVDHLSVRPQVRAQLLELPETRRYKARKSSAAKRGGRSSNVFRLATAWLAAPVIAVIVALALFVSQLASNVGNTPVPVGAAWKFKRPDISFPMAIDPTRANHVLAASYGQAYQSWDAGNTWRRLGDLPPGEVRALVIDWSNPRRYLVALYHSVAVSDDAGGHWRVTASGLLGAKNMFLVQDPRNARIFYVGPSVIWRSEDGGETWHQAGQNVFAPGGVQSLTVLRDGALATGIWGGGVALSQNEGRTWERRSAGLPPGVFDVEQAGNELWAATNRGAYVSSDNGLHWRSGFPYHHLLITGVFPGDGYLLAGGEGGVFRSTNGGRTWHVVSKGLPLFPYVNSFAADPHVPGRVYATLNGDGLFRSDDGGRTWTAADAGLPLPVNGQPPGIVLFRRHGTLWHTDGHGTDPGNLTTDGGIYTAVTSPDGGSIAYVATAGDSWAVRRIGSGGSLAQTAAQGDGTVPTRIFWTPSSSALAFPAGARIYFTDFRSEAYAWDTSTGELLMGWARDGKTLLFWQPDSGRVVSRDPETGRLLGAVAGAFPSMPLGAPDGIHLVVVSGGRLSIGTWDGPARQVERVNPACRPGPWSRDASRFLLICSGTVEERGATGRLLASARVPANAFWAPDSNTDLLFFHHGLWRWSPASGARLIVPHAGSVQPSPSS
jgi:photosystem II stability/assembly factor-like uncharacterized protein